MSLAFEVQHPRHGDGRFQPKPQSSPEVSLVEDAAGALAETVRDLLENSAEHYGLSPTSVQLDDIAAHIRATLAQMA